MSARIVRASEGTNFDRIFPKMPGARFRVIRKEIQDAREKADEMIRAAEAQAAEMEANARMECERIREEAKQQGREAGIQELLETLTRFRDQQKRVYDQSKAEIVRLGLFVAHKILGRELQENDEALAEIVAQAISNKLGHQKRLLLKVHPTDLERLRASLDRIGRQIGPGVQIDFRESNAIQPGGCIIETELGIIDASLDTQLRVMEAHFLRKLKAAPEVTGRQD